jgi:hypothetical protein
VLIIYSCHRASLAFLSWVVTAALARWTSINDCVHWAGHRTAGTDGAGRKLLSDYRQVRRVQRHNVLFCAVRAVKAWHERLWMCRGWRCRRSSLSGGRLAGTGDVWEVLDAREAQAVGSGGGGGGGVLVVGGDQVVMSRSPVPAPLPGYPRAGCPPVLSCPVIGHGRGRLA